MSDVLVLLAMLTRLIPALRDFLLPLATGSHPNAIALRTILEEPKDDLRRLAGDP